VASSGLACSPEFPAAAGVITTAITAELGARATVDDLAGVAPRLLLDASAACRGNFGIPIRGCGTSVALMI